MQPHNAPNPPSRLNRALLGSLGAVLLLAGGGGAAAGLGLLRGPLPTIDPGAPIMGSAVQLASWAPWAAAAAGVIVGILALLWLLAQTRRRPAGGTWQIGDQGTGSGSATLPTAAAAAALARDIENYRGAGSVTATLTGTPTAPAALLDVAVDSSASATDLRRRIATQALPRLRTALQLEALPTQLVLRLDAQDHDQRVR